MKKNILKLTFIAAVAVVAGYTAYNSQKEVALSDLALANVEALAHNEATGMLKRWRIMKQLVLIITVLLQTLCLAVNIVKMKIQLIVIINLILA